jgi:peptidoglycan hydrolase CwlO-like protein
MATLAEMKSHLNELEDQKQKLEAAILKAGQRLKMSLWGIGIGIILLPLYWSGIPILVIAGIMAIFYSLKQTNSSDKLESLESEIHKLEISMA